MPNVIQTKTRTLLGVTDLTLVATIKAGLIPALDARSYESRLRLLLRTIGALRTSSLEAKPTPLLHDAVDRIRGIHAFRVAIAGPLPPRQVVLAVGFDSAWEPYMRRIWRDLGPLLDVIFCNCEGYRSAAHHGFAAYSDWVRSAQVETQFFYTASSLSVEDLHYLRREQQLHIGGTHSAPPRSLPEQAMPALTGLYRLTEVYPPGVSGPPGAADDDGGILLRAAQSLLHAVDVYLKANPGDDLGARTPTEQAAVKWFRRSAAPPSRTPPADAFDRRQVQSGILEPYAGTTHGCMVLLGLDDAAAARALIDHLLLQLVSADGQAAANQTTFVNLGFTCEGLQRIGLDDGVLAQFPQEFREGMAARTSALGDYRHNHPTRWTPPARNWPVPAGASPDRVELSAVHAVVQFFHAGQAGPWHDIPGNDQHPLEASVRHLDQALQGRGVRVLSVQAMQRKLDASGKHSVDHFDFTDGLSQPTLDPRGTGTHHVDTVKSGDLVLGSANSLDDPPLNGPLWNNSTFLVIRKLRQDVAALKDAVGTTTGNQDETLAKMMGRWQDGTNLINGSKDNDFNFAADGQGAKCPFQAHIRRANPRLSAPGVPRPPHEAGLPPAPTPRIMRRGMSYGPRFVDDPNIERGLMFMAYNASIAEQFEVIQRWVAGGNASRDASYSALRDPFLGVPQDHDPQTYHYVDANGNAQTVNLRSDRPFVILQWGMYVFVPSLRALTDLRDVANEVAENPQPDSDYKKRKREREIAGQAARGAALIRHLLALEQKLGFDGATEQWKIALEDLTTRMSGASEWIWTAVRELHGGVLRTPYGVLVGSRQLVNEVFGNNSQRYTVSGYQARMSDSFGEIFLGMDDSEQYQTEAKAVNAAIMGVTEPDAFASAFGHTKNVISALKARGESKVDVKDIVDGVLARVAGDFFGIPDGTDVVAGGWHWDGMGGKPTCPGHFHSPSRYMFQPNPGKQASDFGRQHGRDLRAAVAAFVARHRAPGGNPPGLISPAIFASVPKDTRPDQLASTLIGVMMGFLPTVDGNLRATLYEWANDRSLWDVQLAYRRSGQTGHQRAVKTLRDPLVRTMQLRPVPELVWRIAKTAHALGTVSVNPGDKVVVGIVSAMQQNRIEEDPDNFPVFGGDRLGPAPGTHACPGYRMAMGVMLGALAGLMEFDLKPTLSPLVLEVA